MNKRFISFELILFLSIATLIGIFIGVSWKYFTVPIYYDSNLVVDIYSKDLRPEPIEKIIYIFLVFLCPLICWYTINCNYFPYRIKQSKIWAILTLSFFILVSLHSGLLNYYTGSYDQKTNYAISIYIFFALLLFKPEKLISSGNNFLRKCKIGTNTIILISLIIITVNSLPFRLLTMPEVDTNSIWSIDLDAVLYPISQAMQGKSIFTEYSSQYGGYAVFLGYIFKKIGFSIEKLSFTFLCMQLIAVFGIIWIFKREIHSKAMLLLACLFFGTVTFAIPLYWSNQADPYFQYWPIRFFFPALSISALYFYLISNSFKAAIAFSILSIGSVFWNFDSGIILLTGSLIFIFTDYVYKFYNKSNTMNKLTVTFLSISFVSIISIIIKNSSPINFQRIFEYQLTFYHLGYYMLPMPVRYPTWLFFILIYITGITSFIYVFLRKKLKPKHQIVFFASIIGVGLFSYYQGRSHILNLVAASAWPAYFIICIYCNDLWLMIRKGKGGTESRLYFAAMGSLQMLAIIGLMMHINAVINSCFEKYSHISAQKILNPTIDDEIKFIKTESNNYKNCLILTQRQGLYYASTGIPSSVKGPGLVELISKHDLDSLNIQIKRRDFDCIFLGIDENSSFRILEQLEDSLKNYSKIKVNVSNSIALLV